MCRLIEFFYRFIEDSQLNIIPTGFFILDTLFVHQTSKVDRVPGIPIEHSNICIGVQIKLILMQGLARAWIGRGWRARETLDAAIHTLNAFQGSSIHTRVDPRSMGFPGRSRYLVSREGAKDERQRRRRRRRRRMEIGERERETCSYSVIFEFTRRKQLRW